MTNYCKIKVAIENGDVLDFYYSYHKTTTMDDLLEFIAYYYPQKNICPCYTFQATYENKEIMKLDGNWTFYNCINKYSNFILSSPKDNKCTCDNYFKDNFRKSKIQIIQNLTRSLEINNKKSNIQIDEKNGRILGNDNIVLNEEVKFIDFYDLIIDIKSVKDISKGWDIKMSEKAEKEYQNFKKDKVIRIGVIGNANKGKSFLLSKISQIDLPSGTSIRTEGLSVKYPDNLEKYANRKIVLLDSAGLETPVLIDDDYNEENNLFKEKSREKLITELFLQNYIINNSDILLIVVGILTYSEQKLLNKIKIQL